MKKLQRSSELLWLLGVLCVAFGVCLCSKADLGVSMIAAPAFVLSEALSPLWHLFSVGVAEYALQGLLLILLCVLIRHFHWRYLLTFAVAVLYGYTLNLFLFLMGSVTLDALWMRWCMLLLGDLSVAFGIACFFCTYMPLQVYELFVSELANRFHLNLHKTKWVFDISLLAVSITLALLLFGDATTFDWSSIWHTSFHSIGLGTLVTTAINSPLIRVMSKLLDKLFDPTPLFPKLQKGLQ